MRHYAFSDIHGNGGIFDQMVEDMNKEGDDWICYFLGDACDRGPDGYHIMNTLLDDPQHFVYLKGNHEDMFVKATTAVCNMADCEQLSVSQFMREFEGDPCDLAVEDDDISIYFYNGGLPTLTSWLSAGAPRDIIDKLAVLPLSTSYDKYDMCHAGCHTLLWKSQNEQTFLWDRSHFRTDEEWMPGRILLHGHTPSMRVAKHHCPEKNITNRPLVYSNRTKIDLDTGVVRTGKAYLYDMDNAMFITFPR